MPKTGEAPGKYGSDPLADSLRETVTDKLKEWVDTHPAPDKPIVAAAGSTEPLSPRDILLAVEKRTSLGEEVVSNWVSLLIKTIKEVPL